MKRAWRSFLNRLTPGESLEGLPSLLERYVSRPDALKPGHRIQLLRSGGEAFPAMLEAIRRAERTVLFETYMFRGDEVGESFRLALEARARKGVDVRLIYDAIGSFDLPEKFVRSLRKAGVRTLQFAPIAPWRERWGLNRRNHRKILVVDGKVGFTGGINIGDEYAPLPRGGGWEDLHARVEGPVVHDLARLFRHTWVKGGESAFRLPPPPELIEGEDAAGYAKTIDDAGIRNRSRMHAAYRFAIHASRGSVRIMNAYFLPDALLRRALKRAAVRGSSVRVIVPGVSDQPVVYYASRRLYSRLLRKGVRIFEFHERMMHAKVALVDGVWATIGSYNLDHRSMFHNLEAGIVALDPAFSHELAEEFEEMISRSVEIELAEWERRPLGEQALEWFCYLFRYLL